MKSLTRLTLMFFVFLLIHCGSDSSKDNGSNQVKIDQEYSGLWLLTEGTDQRETGTDEQTKTEEKSPQYVMMMKDQEIQVFALGNQEQVFCAEGQPIEVKNGEIVAQATDACQAVFRLEVDRLGQENATVQLSGADSSQTFFLLTPANKADIDQALDRHRMTLSDLPQGMVDFIHSDAMDVDNPQKAAVKEKAEPRKQDEPVVCQAFQGMCN